jgi:hypothetical protein
MDDEQLEEMRRAWLFQVFRVSAIAGALLGSTLPPVSGLLMASLAGYVIPEPVVVDVGGIAVPVVQLAQGAFTIEILRRITVVVFDGEPEWRKIEK